MNEKFCCCCCCCCCFLQKLMLSTARSHDRGECCLSGLFFAFFKTCWHVRFSKLFAFLFLQKLTSIYWQNLSCEEIPSSLDSDKAALLILLSYSKSLRNKSRRSNTTKSFLTFRIINTSKFLYFQKVLTIKLSQKTHFTTNNIFFFCFIFTA